MKTILYIGGFELPNKNAAAQRVCANAYALRELGYRIILYGVTKNEKISDKKQIIEKNIEYYERKYPNTIFEWIKYIVGIKKIIEILKKETEITHIICYNYPAIALLKIKNYCKKNNIKIVADVTEWYKGEGNLLHKTIKDIDVFFRMRIIHNKLDAIIAISRYLEKYYDKKVKTIYIPPLVNMQEEKWSYTCYNNDVTSEVKLIYAGSPDKNKDKIDKILLALEQVNSFDFKIDILGITEEEFFSKYKIERERLKAIENKITFWGRIDHLDVLKKLKNADFTIFYRPKTKANMAGFPTKFSESIASGICVITNETSDLKHGINGFELEENIEKSLENIFKYNEKRYLKNMKRNVNSYIFDYRNYLEDFKKIF